jgi:glutamate-5-semialdehyde dehydrogenase
MLDRLKMGASVIESTARGVEHVASLPDPIGRRGKLVSRPNGLRVGRQRLPLGVIAIVYESRPDVTVDAAVLCVKSGNAVLLRGGKEASRTNRALVALLQQSLGAAGLPGDAVQMVPPGGREEIRELVGLTDLIDLAIPRGGKGLIRFVAEHARVPVIKHYQGVCHLYLDESCRADQAEALTLNGKVQRPGVCNALECLLVHEREAPGLLPRLERNLVENGVELRACPRALRWLEHAHPAREDDWGAEFLAKILAVKVVGSIDEALEHVSVYGSNHTEAICTENPLSAERWWGPVANSLVGALARGDG